ncbi:hypothetical protein BH23ACT10_BH23ACT10_16660 [soil metagenome]
MDLGQPVARHRIRRAHEAIDLDGIVVEPVLDEQTVDEQPVGSETPEH